jgi:hypothetical protein
MLMENWAALEKGRLEAITQVYLLRLLMDTAWLKIEFVCFGRTFVYISGFDILLAFIGTPGSGRHNTSRHSFFDACSPTSFSRVVILHGIQKLT